ncbi:MAG TPA: TonB-dependent receptor [Thermoanaerobaculia bacterium]|nr:TonB-dependent receptor [Thermoanaerobaculia bacterium]
MLRILVCLFVTVAVNAATLRGRVIDSMGDALPGVSVEMSGAIAITDREGLYEATLDDGIHEVAFRLPGFATMTRPSVRVNGDTRLDVTLQLAISAEVVVTAKETFRKERIGVADAASAGVVTAAEIERRPYQRAGEILETVPGVVTSQHSGEGKANQYYMRGFNLDHGTDIAIDVAGVPVNMPSHAHGQGYADANFLIPELIGGVQYRKGPYAAIDGDFASAGAVDIPYLNMLEQPIALAQAGTFGFGRALVAASPRVGNGFLLFALEGTRDSGPWEQSDDYRRANAVLRYSTGGQHSGASVTLMAYDARWRSTDQIPERAVRDGSISRFGLIDPSDGGSTSRWSLSTDWQRGGTRASAYALQYRLDLFSNFTYFLDDPVHGDQFEQKEERFAYGFEAAHRWLAGRAENVVGIEGRRDDIDDVGLHHTAARRRLSTIREDDVLQTSVGAYAQNAMRWSPRVRTTAGVRFDRYAFEVDVSHTASIASPKLSIIFGPWRASELYVNAGTGFHSNDARGGAGVTPLARTKGAEIGMRTSALPRLELSGSLWALDIASELVFVGDAGTTEAGQPSRRRGVELTATYDARDSLLFDAQYAYSRGRFEDGSRIPGAVEGVASIGVTFGSSEGTAQRPRNPEEPEEPRNRRWLERVSAEVRYRYFGPRPLIEDNTVRSNASNLVNARVGYALTPHVRVDLDLFNALDANVSDVDYFYTSRLRDEAAPVDDVHFHPVEKRSLRIGITTRF